MIRRVLRKMELWLKIKILEMSEDKEKDSKVRVSKGSMRGNRGVVDREKKIERLEKKYRDI